MPSLFNKEDFQQLIERIQRLEPTSTAVWGKMTVAQMLAHLQAPLLVTLGYSKMKRRLIGFLFGNMAKKRMSGPAGFSRNLPTDKTFVVRDQRQFEKERQQLINLLDELHTKGPSAITKDPHPFFGRMKTDEWDLLGWRHIDHHLRQFGV